MSRAWIFAIFTLIDLVIVGGVVWCAFHKIPVGKILVGAAILFVLNGIWLVFATLRNTPAR
jgi:phosphate starvation-inducible membrane PsiE